MYNLTKIFKNKKLHSLPQKLISYIPLKEKKLSVFDQSNFNPYHVYPLYKMKRKAQAKFEDPEYKITKIPSPVKENGKQLIKILEQEELAKIKSQNGLKKDSVKLGQNVQAEYYRSITGKKIKKIKGVVIGYKKQKSLQYSFKILTMIGGMYVAITYPMYSPMLASLKVVGGGGFSLKRKIYNYRKLPKFGNRLDEIMKGGKNVNVTKARTRKLRKLESQKESIVIE
jgi:ribosomal protein L19